jgi:hypothetical protein
MAIHNGYFGFMLPVDVADVYGSSVNAKISVSLWLYIRLLLLLSSHNRTKADTTTYT